MLTCPESPANTAAPNALRCHPASPCAAVSAIAVKAALTATGALALGYRVHGDPAGLHIPAPLPPGHADGLWQHTCLEAFVAVPQGHFLRGAVDSEEYREFNFSPAGQWAAYRFTACRQRDVGFMPAVAPQIAFEQCADGFRLDALIAPELLPAGRSLALGLTAVIEAADGSKSYWALAHCAAQPDFHLRQSFALALHRTAP